MSPKLKGVNSRTYVFAVLKMNLDSKLDLKDKKVLQKGSFLFCKNFNRNKESSARLLSFHLF